MRSDQWLLSYTIFIFWGHLPLVVVISSLCALKFGHFSLRLKLTSGCWDIPPFIFSGPLCLRSSSFQSSVYFILLQKTQITSADSFRVSLRFQMSGRTRTGNSFNNRPRFILWMELVWTDRLFKLSKMSANANGGPCSLAAQTWRFARPPIDMSGNFPRHVSAVSPSTISPNPWEVIPKVSEP